MCVCVCVCGYGMCRCDDRANVTSSSAAAAAAADVSQAAAAGNIAVSRVTRPTNVKLDVCVVSSDDDKLDVVWPVRGQRDVGGASCRPAGCRESTCRH